MDEIKKISEDEINEIASQYPFNRVLLTKDYYITALLYLLRDVEGIYFKGGTALQKIFLDYSRISEDIDFTLSRDLEKVKAEIKKIITGAGLFDKITQDKDVEGFTRLVAYYKGFTGKGDSIFIDLNKRSKLATHPENHKITHFYKSNIPQFSIHTISKEEMIAEKVAATIGRNKPRDHYDVYQIIKKGIPINIGLVKKKCRDSGDEFNVIKMFNNANKLHKRWHEDLAPLLVEETTFKQVMTVLARHFRLKEEKEKKNGPKEN